MKTVSERAGQSDTQRALVVLAAATQAKVACAVLAAGAHAVHVCAVRRLKNHSSAPEPRRVERSACVAGKLPHGSVEHGAFRFAPLFLRPGAQQHLVRELGDWLLIWE